MNEERAAEDQYSHLLRKSSFLNFEFAELKSSSEHCIFFLLAPRQRSFVELLSILPNVSWPGDSRRVTFRRLTCPHHSIFTKKRTTLSFLNDEQFLNWSR